MKTGMITQTFAVSRTVRLAIGSVGMALAFAGHAQVVSSVSGANAAAIQSTVDAFRSLGPLNPNVSGSFGIGRREINWDGVPDVRGAEQPARRLLQRQLAARRRLLDAGHGLPGERQPGLRPPVEFGNLNPTYPGLFPTFSSQRLFTALGCNIIDVVLRAGRSTTPALTRGFGVVFTDVDLADTRRCSSSTPAPSLGTFYAPASAATRRCRSSACSFRRPQVARVRIISGNGSSAPRARNADHRSGGDGRLHLRRARRRHRRDPRTRDLGADARRSRCPRRCRTPPAGRGPAPLADRDDNRRPPEALASAQAPASAPTASIQSGSPRHVVAHVGTRQAAARRHMERMVGAVEDLERGALAEPRDHGRSSPRSASSSRVPCRNSIGSRPARGAARARRRACRPDAAESRRRPGRGRPAAVPACACDVIRPPNDLPPANSGRPGALGRPGDGGAHRGVRDCRRIGTPRASLHRRELEAQRGDAALGSPSATLPGRNGSCRRRRHAPRRRGRARRAANLQQPRHRRAGGRARSSTACGEPGPSQRLATLGLLLLAGASWQTCSTMVSRIVCGRASLYGSDARRSGSSRPGRCRVRRRSACPRRRHSCALAQFEICTWRSSR